MPADCWSRRPVRSGTPKEAKRGSLTFALPSVVWITMHWSKDVAGYKARIATRAILFRGARIGFDLCVATSFRFWNHGVAIGLGTLVVEVKLPDRRS